MDEAETETSEAMDEAETETSEAMDEEGRTGTGGSTEGALVLGGLLPETGNLAFLGPPEFAGVEPAVAGHQRRRRRARTGPRVAAR